jgi:hypothetical protein
MAKERAEEDLAGSPDAPRPNTGPHIRDEFGFGFGFESKKERTEGQQDHKSHKDPSELHLHLHVVFGPLPASVHIIDLIKI